MIEKALAKRREEILRGRQTKLITRVKTQAQGIWPVKESSHQEGKFIPVSYRVNGANDLNY